MVINSQGQCCLMRDTSTPETLLSLALWWKLYEYNNIFFFSSTIIYVFLSSYLWCKFISKVKAPKLPNTNPNRFLTSWSIIRQKVVKFYHQVTYPDGLILLIIVKFVRRNWAILLRRFSSLLKQNLLI